MARMWITRNALTKGVCQVDGEFKGKRYFVVNRALGNFVVGLDCFANKEDALKVAEAMRQFSISQTKMKIKKAVHATKIEKLTEKLRDLENLSFESSINVTA
ncbi:MAG: hypothetical protein ACRDBG_27995 [Waterburya sp.]